MAYTLKERFASKRKIQSMSLSEILAQYGNGDLLKTEINKRINLNIDEVRDFYKNEYLVKIYKPDRYTIYLINSISSQLKIEPIKLLEWDCINIDNEIASEFLSSNDFWLTNDIIVNKVSKNFLYETLLKNENIYKHSELIEILPNNLIIEIITSENIDFNKINNFEKLLALANLSKENLNLLINKIANSNNFNLLIQLRNENIITINDLTNVILMYPQKFINIINNIPKNLLENLFENQAIINYFNLEISKEELFKIIIANPNLFTIIKGSKNTEEFLANIFQNINNVDISILDKFESYKILSYLDNNPELESQIIRNPKFLNYITFNEENIIKYMHLINKYNIHNDTINSLQSNFKRIQEVRPELSWGNTSIRPEMIHSDFIDILGENYINAILQFDSDTSDIAVDLYKQGKLQNLKIWLDYVSNNISINFRMVHYYIMAYQNMESLINDILKNNFQLDGQRKIILEDIILNKNKYNISNIEKLNNYFQIKIKQTLENKVDLTVDEFLELFLSSKTIRDLYPPKLGLKPDLTLLNELDYIKYKYVDTGIITIEEYQLLLKIKQAYDTKNNEGRIDFGVINNLITSFQGNVFFTTKSIWDKIEEAKTEELSSKLLDLDELHKIASYTDPTAPVYIETKDGIEYIYLNGYDFKCLSNGIGRKGDDVDLSTSSSMIFGGSRFYENNTEFSEIIKGKIGYSGINDFKMSNMILDNPEIRNLVEGSTRIATGICSSRSNFKGIYGWGKKSNIKYVGSERNDAQSSHEIRSLLVTGSGMYEKSIPFQVLYGHLRGEIFFDRFTTDNKRIHPEFIISAGKDSETAARYYGVPIIIENQESYGPEFEKKLDKEARKKFSENLDVSGIEDILFNAQNQDKQEKVSFILSTLQQALKVGKLSLEQYKSKLIDLKWKLYESGDYEKEMEMVDSMIAQIEAPKEQLENTKSITIEDKPKQLTLNRGIVNYKYLSIIIITILLGIIVGLFFLSIKYKR